MISCNINTKKAKIFVHVFTFNIIVYEPSYLHTQVVHGVKLEICTAYEVVVVLPCKVHHPQAVLEPGVGGCGGIHSGCFTFLNLNEEN